VTTTVCLSGTGEHFPAFSLPTPANPNRQALAFVSSKTTGIVSPLLADPNVGDVRWSEFSVANIDLCDSAKEQALGFPVCDGSKATPNHAAPAGMFWSQATEKIYAYLSGYGSVVELDPGTFSITRRVDITPTLPSQTVFHSVGITPNGRSLFLVGEDKDSDPTQVIGRFGSIDLTVAFPAPLSATELSFPQLSNIRPARFQFTPDGARIYMTQSNGAGGLNPVQAQNLRKDLLLIFDPSFISLVSELALPAAEMHAMDLWITGPHGAGSAKGVVVTNATAGVSGTVSLIDAATNTITATIPVGKNPKQVTVYYYGLVASDNQATPIW
jgi:YVTN family beta-propeller protein